MGKRNPILENMKNKVSVIDGAIEQCKRLKNNETIVLNGLHTLNIARGKMKDKDLNDRIFELMQERCALQQRISIPLIFILPTKSVDGIKSFSFICGPVLSI